MVTESYEAIEEAKRLANKETEILVRELSRTIGMCHAALGKEFDAGAVFGDFPKRYEKLIRYSYSAGYKEGRDLVVND